MLEKIDLKVAKKAHLVLDIEEPINYLKSISLESDDRVASTEQVVII